MNLKSIYVDIMKSPTSVKLDLSFDLLIYLFLILYKIKPRLIYHGQIVMISFSFRFDDPLLLERYRMMQSSFLPYPHPGMLPPHGLAPLLPPGSRYPPELLPPHQMNLMSPGGHMLDNKSSSHSAER